MFTAACSELIDGPAVDPILLEGRSNLGRFFDRHRLSCEGMLQIGETQLKMQTQRRKPQKIQTPSPGTPAPTSSASMEHPRLSHSFTFLRQLARVCHHSQFVQNNLHKYCERDSVSCAASGALGQPGTYQLHTCCKLGGPHARPKP